MTFLPIIFKFLNLRCANANFRNTIVKWDDKNLKKQVKTIFIRIIRIVYRCNDRKNFKNHSCYHSW